MEAVMKAQVAKQSSNMEKLNQVLLKSMTKMELKIEEQKKELYKAQKEFEVRLKAHPKSFETFILDGWKNSIIEIWMSHQTPISITLRATIENETDLSYNLEI